jgi:hypothetical protein
VGVVDAVVTVVVVIVVVAAVEVEVTVVAAVVVTAEAEAADNIFSGDNLRLCTFMRYPDWVS